MQYTTLGKSGIKISRICLGCMGFGVADGQHPWTIDYEQSKVIIARALELGINFFDTAMSYAGGTSEQFLGKAIKELANRKDVVIATKFLPRTAEEIANGVTGQQHVLNCLNNSLARLDMQYVDLYILHMWDYHTPIEEIMDGLDTAVRMGKIKAIGISNCYAWQLEKANAIAEKYGWAKFVSMQGHYNLIFREEEREMLPCCEENGITFTPYSPLASGRLVKGKDETSNRLTLDHIAKGKYGGTIEQDKVIIGRVAEIARNNGLTNTQVALGWLLSKATSPIVGATKLKHIEEAAKAVGITLSADDINYLEQPYVPHKLVGVMSFNHK